MSTRSSSGSLKHKHPYLKEVHGGLTYMVKGFPEDFKTSKIIRKGDWDSKILRIDIVPSTVNK